MKVRELIERLQRENPEAEVLVTPRGRGQVQRAAKVEAGLFWSLDRGCLSPRMQLGDGDILEEPSKLFRTQVSVLIEGDGS